MGQGGDVIRSVRVLNAEVLSVRHLVIGDLDHDEYDSLNPVLLNASARDLQGYVDALPSLVAGWTHRLILVNIEFFLFYATFPNTTHTMGERPKVKRRICAMELENAGEGERDAGVYMQKRKLALATKIRRFCGCKRRIEIIYTSL